MSLGVRTPLKITEGGRFLPSAATASVTVKLLFSAPQDFTGTVLVPLNSRVLLDGSSNRIGVSKLFIVLKKRKTYLDSSALKTSPVVFDPIQDTLAKSSPSSFALLTF